MTSPGKVTTIEYDEYAMQKSLLDPDAGKMEYDYNSFGEIIYQKDQLGNIYQSTYDLLGRMKTQTEASWRTPNVKENYKYTYDDLQFALGQLTKVEGPNGHVQSFKFDNQSRIIEKSEVIRGKTYLTKMEYDKFNRLTKVIYPSGVIEESKYTANGFLKEVFVNSKLLWRALEYDQFGNLKSYLSGNGKVTNLTYDDWGVLRTKKTNGIHEWEFVFNPATGNLESRTDLRRGLKESFTYDNLDRLEKIYQGTTETMSVSYKPDGTSNIASKLDAGTYKYDKSDRPHELTQLDDLKGTISQETQNSTDYTPFNSISFVEESNKKLEFTYGSGKERIYTDYFVNSTLVQSKVFAGNYEEEIDAAGFIRKITYLSGGNGLTAIMVNNGGKDTLYYVYTDHLGSLQVFTDENGLALNDYEMSFDAWGRRRDSRTWVQYNYPVAEQEKAITLFDRGYTGHEHLYDFGLINMNGRVYDPVLGLMLSPDNYVSDATNTVAFNRYLYCNGNPLKYTDPSGEIIESILIGAGISILTNGLDNVVNGQPFFKGAGRAALIGGLGGAFASGIGTTAKGLGKVGGFAFQALAHGYIGGAMSTMNGGTFEKGFISGASGSVVSSLAGGIVKGAPVGWQGVGIIGGGTLAGGLSSHLAGGDFWDGARNGAISSTLNHFAHSFLREPNKYPKWVREKMAKELKSGNGEKVSTWEEFISDNKGLSYEEIINQRKDRSWISGSQPGGPNLRYVQDPMNPDAVLDMRHLLVVGKKGKFIGNSLELFQFIMNQPSGGNYQDYYSNKLGYGFFKSWGNNIMTHPNETTKYLDWYINNPNNR